jgi:hypothetical protein
MLSTQRSKLGNLLKEQFCFGSRDALDWKVLLFFYFSIVKDIVCRLYSCGSCEKRELNNATVHHGSVREVLVLLTVATSSLTATAVCTLLFPIYAISLGMLSCKNRTLWHLVTQRWKWEVEGTTFNPSSNERNNNLLTLQHWYKSDSYYKQIYHHNQHHHHLANTQLAHSCLTHLDVLLLVSVGFFCLLVCSFLLSSAVQYKAFCVHGARNVLLIPAFYTKL